MSDPDPESAPDPGLDPGAGPHPTARLLVGVHFRRHFGGPGHLEVAPGSLVLTDRRGRRRVEHDGDVVVLEHKRWEAPTGNRWLAISDGTTTAWATMSRRRAARVVSALEAAGYAVQGPEGAR